MKKRFYWRVCVFELEFSVKVNTRPDIEETEINYLNGKMWIPGPLSCHDIELSFVTKEDLYKFVSLNPQEIVLRLYGPDRATLYESWLIKMEKFKVEKQEYCYSCGQKVDYDPKLRIFYKNEGITYKSNQGNL